MWLNRGSSKSKMYFTGDTGDQVLLCPRFVVDWWRATDITEEAARNAGSEPQLAPVSMPEKQRVPSLSPP